MEEGSNKNILLVGILIIIIMLLTGYIIYTDLIMKNKVKDNQPTEKVSSIKNIQQEESIQNISEEHKNLINLNAETIALNAFNESIELGDEISISNEKAITSFGKGAYEKAKELGYNEATCIDVQNLAIVNAKEKYTNQ